MTLASCGTVVNRTTDLWPEPGASAHCRRSAAVPPLLSRMSNCPSQTPEGRPVYSNLRHRIILFVFQRRASTTWLRRRCQPNLSQHCPERLARSKPLGAEKQNKSGASSCYKQVTPSGV